MSAKFPLDSILLGWACKFWLPIRMQRYLFIIYNFTLETTGENNTLPIITPPLGGLVRAPNVTNVGESVVFFFGFYLQRFRVFYFFLLITKTLEEYKKLGVQPLPPNAAVFRSLSNTTPSKMPIFCSSRSDPWQPSRSISGLTYDPVHKLFWLAYGANDCEARLAQMQAEEVRRLFLPSIHT